MISILRAIYSLFVRLSDTLRISLLNARPGIVIDKSGHVHKGAQIKIWKGGSITIGKKTEILPGVLIYSYGGDIMIGDHCSINPYCILYGHGGLRIGNNVLIAGGTMVIPNNHVTTNINTPIAFQGNLAKGITIEDDVWIGHGCSILDGVVVGKGSVVAAGAVVTTDVAPYSIVGGIPAKLIRMRS